MKAEAMDKTTQRRLLHWAAAHFRNGFGGDPLMGDLVAVACETAAGGPDDNPKGIRSPLGGQGGVPPEVRTLLMSQGMKIVKPNTAAIYALLLQNKGAPFSVGEVAQRVECNDPAASQVLRGLARRKIIKNVRRGVYSS